MVKGTLMARRSNSKRVFVLDGYNVISRSPKLRAQLDRSLETARNGLVNDCQAWLTHRRDAIEFVIVFDGCSDALARPAGGRPRIRLIFTETDEEADDRILAMLPRIVKEGAVTVVTDDARVKRGAQSLGADTVAVSEFAATIMRTKKRAHGSPAVGHSPDITPRQAKEINDSLIEEWGLE